MDMQGFLDSRQGIWFGLAISRLLPPRMGQSFTQAIARYLISKPDMALVQAVRANQWVASGCAYTKEELDQATLACLQVITYSLYEMFHFYGKHKTLLRRVKFSQQVLDLIENSHAPIERGLILCGVHMSNFDLALHATTLQGLQALALTMPDATEAIEWQHKQRRKSGVQVLPATLSNMRQVFNHLNDGGIVVTGVDRPMLDTKCCPSFFGRPAHLPVHYIQLAMVSGAPLAVLAPIQQEDGRYHFVYSDLMEIKPGASRNAALYENAERILEIAEGFIRLAPEQWSISQAAWPDAIHEMP